MVLMAVSFVMVINYQRSLHQLEFDGIAKEIFIAAQNHLTMADSQGIVTLRAEHAPVGVTQSTFIGNEESKAEEIYYFIIPEDDPDNTASVLNLLLPEFSVDETVRRGGSYVIRYQKSSALVLDVFYSPRKGIRFGQDYNEIEYDTLLGLRGTNNKAARRNYNGAILGWYGGEGTTSQRKPIRFDPPAIRVINEETLRVEISGLPTGELFSSTWLQLVIKGKTSGQTKSIDLLKNESVSSLPPDVQDFVVIRKDGKITVYLDDVTDTAYEGGSKGKHFSELFPAFYPGEDLEITAVVYSNAALANIATSAAAVTNSLFADPFPYRDNEEIMGTALEEGIVGIGNIRHLENLDVSVSQVRTTQLHITTAVQTSNLSWTDFKSKTGGDSTVIRYEDVSSSASTQQGKYKPVNPTSTLIYNGQNHQISNVEVDYTGNAGLFGTSTYITEIKNLELLDFNVTGTSAAGALAGSLTGTKVENVLARNSTNSADVNITASAGSAGGLIGSANNCTVSKSAAALIVNGSTNAGGLIGTASGGSVTASYAGGHVIPIKNGSETIGVEYSTTNWNVKANDGVAGGLIGDADNNIIVTSSYSTCSVYGKTAGGFVGSGSGVDISNSYSTGLVQGTTTEGAFAGSITGNASGWYYQIINARSTDASGYLPAIGEGSGSIEQIDESASAYDTFSGSPDNWESAYPYEEALEWYYQNKYNLKSVSQLNDLAPAEKKITIEPDDFVAKPYAHHGDWPAPELFVLNEKN